MGGRKIRVASKPNQVYLVVTKFSIPAHDQIAGIITVDSNMPSALYLGEDWEYVDETI